MFQILNADIFNQSIIYAAYYIFMGISCAYFMSQVQKQSPILFVVSALGWPLMFPLAFVGLVVINIIIPPIPDKEKK